MFAMLTTQGLHSGRCGTTTRGQRETSVVCASPHTPCKLPCLSLSRRHQPTASALRRETTGALSTLPATNQRSTAGMQPLAASTLTSQPTSRARLPCCLAYVLSLNSWIVSTSSVDSSDRLGSGLCTGGRGAEHRGVGERSRQPVGSRGSGNVVALCVERALDRFEQQVPAWRWGRRALQERGGRGEQGECTAASGGAASYAVQPMCRPVPPMDQCGRPPGPLPHTSHPIFHLCLNAIHRCCSCRRGTSRAAAIAKEAAR